jgi:hypothetical protein
MTEQDIWVIVMERFPKLDKERTCRMEREFRNMARQSYKLKLIETYTKANILAGSNEDAAKNAS